MDGVELTAQVAANTKDIENLKGWQKTQNGSLQRLADKVDKLYVLALTAALSGIGSLIVLLLRG